MSIRVKLKLSLLALVLSLLLVGYIGIYATLEIDENQELADQVTKLLSIEENMNSTIVGVLSITDPALLDDALLRYNGLIEAFYEIVDETMEHEDGELQNIDESEENLLEEIEYIVPQLINLLQQNIDALENLGRSIIQTQKEKLVAQQTFEQKYTEEKDQRKAVRKVIFQVDNANILKEIGALQYYSKEALYQYKDEKHLSYWIQSIDTLKTLFQSELTPLTDTTKAQLFQDLDQYQGTAQVLGNTAIQLKQFDTDNAQKVAEFHKLIQENQQRIIAVQRQMDHFGGALIRNVTIVQFVLLAIVAICAFLLSAYISRNLSSVVIHLKKGVDKVSEGDLTSKISAIPDNEFQSLANAFNNMTDELLQARQTLEEYNQQLEGKVKERTLELEQAKDALEDSHQKLEVEHQNLKNTQTQLVHAEKMSGLGTLAAGVAHEINNPSNFIHGGSANLQVRLSQLEEFIYELAGDNITPTLRQAFKSRFDPMERSIKSIQEGTTRIKTIVDDLRTFSRLDEAEQKTVSVVESLRATLGLLHANYNQHVDFTHDFQADPPLDCSPAQLNQVFMNIALNACQAIEAKASPPGQLTVSTKVENNQLVVSFIDNGTGISPDNQPHIFEPFFTTKDVGAGVGLGLSTAFGIIEKHQGHIEVESVVGEGSTFIIFLPLSR